MQILQPKQFGVRPGSFKEIKRQYLFKLLPLLVLAIAIGLTISHYNSRPTEEEDATVLPIVIPFTLILVSISVYRGLNRSKALFESFTLTIEPNSIIRDQLNTPVIHIYQSEITAISRLKNGCILIKSEEASNLIAIPPEIEKKEELEAILSKIQPISETPKLPLVQKYPVALTIVMLVLMGLVFTSTNKYIVGVGGPLLAAILIWAVYEGRRSKNIDERTKKNLWWVVIVIVAVLGRAVLILLGYE